ncbi:MAG: BlaI/MecI/CopY family transcriptional regulator [Pirellulaceae bacterium]|nr:BlaI/MecI/CopY family transcriptional regulator [Pirellulaceae bacterium]
MVERPDLSKWEMDVARIVWEIGPASVREVHERLAQQREIDFTTVQTYLRRMESKGYLNSKLQGRIRIYSARTRPGTVIREIVNDLVDRLFGGELMQMMRHLIEDHSVDSDDIAELRSLVEQLEVEQQEKERKSGKQ